MHLEILFLKDIETRLIPYRWAEFQTNLSDINKAGGFDKFVTGIIEMANEAGVLDSIPGGKIAGIALKTIVGLLSSSQNA